MTPHSGIEPQALPICATLGSFVLPRARREPKVVAGEPVLDPPASDPVVRAKSKKVSRREPADSWLSWLPDLGSNQGPTD